MLDFYGGNMKNISEKLFFLAYGIYLIFYIFNVSFYARYIDKYTRIVIILCVVIELCRELFCTKLSKKELFFLIVCFLLSGLLLLHLNGISMLPLFFFIYGARNIDFRKIAKFTVIVSSTLLVFIIMSAELGLITNYKRTSFGRTRIYLGFRYPLFPQMILFNINLANLYVHKGKISFLRCIFWSLMNYWMFCYTDARLSCYLAILLTFIIFIIDKKPKILEKRKILCFILIFSFPISCIFSVYTTYQYSFSNQFMVSLDKALGRRLQLGKNSLYEYEINLFGNDTKFVGAGLGINGERGKKEYNYVDCMYINLLEKYGIIFNVIFLILLTLLLYETYKSKNYTLFIILVGLALHGIIDDLEIYLYYNVFWLSVSTFFDRRNIISENISGVSEDKESLA